MREIKFRAWHLDEGMLYFDFDTFKSGYHDQYDNIMQFTGLQDKNGVDIYEGDILFKKHNGFGIVEYKGFGFECISIKKKSDIFKGIILWRDKVEVIGNIHTTKL